MRSPRSHSLAVLTLIYVSLPLPSRAQSMCNTVSNNPLVMQMLCSEPPKAQAVPATLRSTLPKQPPDLQPITAEAINHMRLVEAPPISRGDVLRYQANRNDFILELFFGNGKEIVVQPLTPADAENIQVRWKQGETKLDYPETLNQQIIRMRIKPLHQMDAPLLLRGVQITRNGQTIVQLQVTYTGPNQTPFEPPMSYPPDPMTPNPHMTNVSVSRSDLLGHKPDTGFLAPKLPSYSMNPMMFQSTTTTTTGDPNHYKFQGKELDAETGLYNFGARYYNPALSRFMSPDWSAKPTAVPYANFTDPQTLNLYTFGRNNPLSMRDSDGHCTGDDCSNVKVDVKVTQPAKIVQNERQSAGDYATGVRAKVQYTITDKGKPLSNTPVAEKNTGKRTLNGEERPNKINEQNSSTNSQGQLNDTFGLMGHSDTPLSADDNKGFVDVLSNNNVTTTGTQTLTFQDQAGTTCSCTVDRTLTNENKDGTNNGSSYTFTTSKPSAVKPVEQPKDKKQQQ